MWQNSFTITEIVPLAIPNISPNNFKPFSLPNIIKYIAHYEKLRSLKP